MNLCIASMAKQFHFKITHTCNNIPAIFLMTTSFTFATFFSLKPLEELSESVHWSSHITALCNCFTDFKFTGWSILIKSLASRSIDIYGLLVVIFWGMFQCPSPESDKKVKTSHMLRNNLNNFWAAITVHSITEDWSR